MTTLVQRIESAEDDKKSNVVRDLVEAHKTQFELALAGTIDPAKFSRVALTAIRSNPKLQEANIPSLLGALMGAAQLGLEPHGPLEHCYLVPYKTEVQLIIGYKGMEQLAYRSGLVSSIVARPVYEGDVFDFEFGTSEYIHHIPRGGTGGKVSHAYAVGSLVTGGKVPVVLFREDIEKARNRSASEKSDHSPWKSDYDMMARKTAIRRLFRDLPATTETQRALGYDERSGSDIDWQSDMEGDVVDVTPEEQV